MNAPSNITVGQVYRGKHRDNESKFLLILDVNETHALGQTSGTGTRSWSLHDHFSKRYQLWTGEAPPFPAETGPRPAPPGKDSAPQLPLAPPAPPKRITIVLEGDAAEAFEALMVSRQQAIAGLGGEVTPASLTRAMIKAEIVRWKEAAQ